MKAIIIAGFVIVLGGGLGNYLRFMETAPDHPPRFELIPYDVNGYSGVERRFDDRSYDVLGADTTTLRLYRDSTGRACWLFVAYFASQKYGSQMHSPKHCLPGGGWRIERIEPFDLTLPDGSARRIKRLVISLDNRKQAMFYWFQTRGGVITDEFTVKWDLMMNSLKLRPTDAAFVRLTLSAEDGMEEATDRAVALLRALENPIQSALPFDS